MERADVDRPSRIGRAEVTEGSRTTDRALISRRTAIGGAFGAALVTLLARPEWATAQERVVQEDFVILLQGRYKPVVDGPDLGLTMVDLSDGSYSKVKIYPVSGTPNSTHAPQAIGYFYVQFDGSLCAYKLPGGALAMEFTGSDYDVINDGAGGVYWRGTFELTVLEATEDYQSFVGGHNKMFDNLHLLASGDADEFCFCDITLP